MSKFVQIRPRMKNTLICCSKHVKISVNDKFYSLETTWKHVIAIRAQNQIVPKNPKLGISGFNHQIETKIMYKWNLNHNLD